MLAHRNGCRGLLVFAALVAAFGADAPTSFALQGECATSLPVYGYLRPPSTPEDIREQVWPLESAVDPTVGIARIDLPEMARAIHPDIDGDGKVDEIIDDGNDLIVRANNGSDQLVISEPGLSLSVATAAPYFDLDGDGRDELFLLARDPVTAVDRFFIIPGTVDFGSVVASEVGIEIPEELVVGVGDQLATGGDDLYTAAGLVDGLTVMATPPGGELLEFELASGPLTLGYLAGAADLGGAVPALVLVDVIDDQPAITVSAVAGQYSLELPAGVDFSQPQSVATYEYESGWMLELTQSDRDGSLVYLWDLDPTCRATAATARSLPSPETSTSIIATESEATTADNATQAGVSQSSALAAAPGDEGDKDWTRIGIGAAMAAVVVAAVAFSFRRRQDVI